MRASLSSYTISFEVRLASLSSGLEKIDHPDHHLCGKILSLFPRVQMSGEWELEGPSLTLLYVVSHFYICSETKTLF